MGWDGAARTTGRTAASSLSVFIGECILDILAIKSSSTKFPSPDAVAEGVLDVEETTRASADLFLRAATFIESPDPQRSEEQELEEEKGDADRAAAKPAATGVPGSSSRDASPRCAGVGLSSLRLISSISCRRRNATLVALSVPSFRPTGRMRFIVVHRSRDSLSHTTRKPRQIPTPTRVSAHARPRPPTLEHARMEHRGNT